MGKEQKGKEEEGFTPPMSEILKNTLIAELI